MYRFTILEPVILCAVPVHSRYYVKVHALRLDKVSVNKVVERMFSLGRFVGSVTWFI